MAVVWLAVLVFYDLRWAVVFAGSARHFLVRDWRTLRGLLLLSIPLGLVMTMVSLNVNIPRYLLEHYLGTAQLGVFASLAYLVVALSLIVNALGQSASTRLAQMFADRRFRAFRILILKLAMFGVIVVCAGVPVALFLGRPLLTLLYRPEYGEYSRVLAVMVATAGVTAIGSFLGYGITAARKFREQVPLIACSTLSAVVASILLIPKMGLMGAAVALFISALVFVSGGLWIIRAALRAGAKVSRT
jgi:O-antigen/teichoic acid export membrane protein